MSTALRTAPSIDRPAGPGSTRTRAGVALQASWLAVIGYGIWGSVAGPEHPPLPAAVETLLGAFGIVMLATTAGLVVRHRWALWASTASALPLAGAAVMCFVADAGPHWVAEAALAMAVTFFSLHPQSWRMHTR